MHAHLKRESYPLVKVGMKNICIPAYRLRSGGPWILANSDKSSRQSGPHMSRHSRRGWTSIRRYLSTRTFRHFTTEKEVIFSFTLMNKEHCFLAATHCWQLSVQNEEFHTMRMTTLWQKTLGLELLCKFGAMAMIWGWIYSSVTSYINSKLIEVDHYSTVVPHLFHSESRKTQEDSDSWNHQVCFHKWRCFGMAGRD